MSNRNLSLDALKNHLFKAIEGVENLSDKTASANEKMSIEQAREIVDLSGKVIDIYKTQLDAMRTIERFSDVGKAKVIMHNAGMLEQEVLK